MFTKLTASTALSLVLLPFSCGAASGDLDTSFASNGIAISAIDLIPGGIDEIHDLVVSASGEVYQVGMAQADWTNSAIAEPVIVKHTAQGTIDTNFGIQGVVRVPSVHGVGFAGAVYGAILQNGNLLVASNEFTSNGDLDIILLQFKPNGDRDWSGFTLPWSGLGLGQHSDEAVGDVAVDSQGRIVVVGSTNAYQQGMLKMLVARFLPSGLQDPGFANGSIATASPIANENSEALTVEVAINGDVYVGGVVQTSYSDTDFAIWKLKADGSTDATYGNNGTRTFWFDINGYHDDVLRDLALRSDGSLVAVGEANHGTNSGKSSVAVTAFDPSGTVVTSFGNQTPRNGRLTFNLGQGLEINGATGIATRTDGKMVVGMHVSRTNGRDFGSFRLLANGDIDINYGLFGLQLYSFTYGNNDEVPFAIGVDANNRTLLAGYAGYSNTDHDFMVVRLKP